MLQIWFDDSGKDGKSPVFVLAGYLATVEDWCGFADDWKALLHQGPKPLDYIKGYEAFGFNKQFIGWNTQAVMLGFASSLKLSIDILEKDWR